MRRPLEPKQYASLTFTQALTHERIAGSNGSVGDALDNALMESTVGLFKLDCIHRHDRPWTGRAEVETATAEWVAWFNTTRLPSSLDHLPPAEFEDRYRATHHGDLKPQGGLNPPSSGSRTVHPVTAHGDALTLSCHQTFWAP